MNSTNITENPHIGMKENGGNQINYPKSFLKLTENLTNLISSVGSRAFGN